MLLEVNRLLILASALAHSVLGSARAPVILPRATVCNGNAELCNKSFGNVTFVGAHDSYAIGVNNRESTYHYDLSISPLSTEPSYSCCQPRPKWYTFQTSVLSRFSTIPIVTQQLNDGIRMLQMQAHNQSGTIQLCHTSCV